MSEKEMKNTIGGVVQLAVLGIDSGGSGGNGAYPCNNTKCKKNSDCSKSSCPITYDAIKL